MLVKNLLSKNEINYDLQSLIKSWETIKENAMNSIAPKLIHQESDIIKRTLRDIYDDETQNIIIDGNDGYQKAKSFAAWEKCIKAFEKEEELTGVIKNKIKTDLLKTFTRN